MLLVCLSVVCVHVLFALLQRVEVVEDFVRNFLASHEMYCTLEAFQAEWYRLLHTNKLHSGNTETLPDVYVQYVPCNIFACSFFMTPTYRDGGGDIVATPHALPIL